MFLAIDPSINTCGVSLYDPATKDFEWKLVRPEGRNLVRRMECIESEIARFLRFRNCNFAGITHLVCEYPQFFNSEKGAVAATMGYTLDLAAICGYMAGICKFAKVDFYTPQQWKGNLTKKAIEFRFQKMFGDIPLPSEHEQEATLMLYYHLGLTVGVSN